MPSFKYQRLISSYKHNDTNHTDYYLEINGEFIFNTSEECNCFINETKYETLKKNISSKNKFKKIKNKCDENNNLTEISAFNYNYRTTHGTKHCECSKKFTPLSVQLKKKT